MSRVQALDFSVDLMSALLWQYNDAARLESLLAQKQTWYDVNQSAFWSDWVRDVFDLRTANDFGLSVWSIILDFPAVIQSQEPADKPIWGFGQYREPFNNGNFARSTSALSTDQRRLALQLRYFQLVTTGAVPEVNEFFAYVFAPYGPAYVTDGLDMTAVAVMGFPIPPGLEVLFAEFDLLPRPAGVKLSVISSVETNGWGFGRYRDTFTQGNFYHA